MKVGVTFDQREYDSHLALYPGNAACRVFSKTDALPAWTSPAAVRLMAAGIMPHLSCRGYHPAKWKRALDTMPPPDVLPEVAVTQHHEPENDQKTTSRAEWLTTQRALYEITCAHPNRDRVKFISIQSKSYIVGSGADAFMPYWTGISDAFAADAYLASWGDAGIYSSPERFVAPMLDFAHQVQRRLWVTELGAVKRPGDPADTGRAEWITEVMGLLDASGLCDLVMWWCDMGVSSKLPVPGLGTGRDFHLERDHVARTAATGAGNPSQLAYAQFMNSAPRRAGRS